MVLETIPSHPQVLARTVLVGTFPRLDLKPSLSKDGLNFLLEVGELYIRFCSYPSIIDVSVFQYGLKNDWLKRGGGESLMNVWKAATFGQVA